MSAPNVGDRVRVVAPPEATKYHGRFGVVVALDPDCAMKLTHGVRIDSERHDGGAIWYGADEIEAVYP